MDAPDPLDARISRHEAASPRGVVVFLHGGGEGDADLAVAPIYGGFVRMRFLHWCIRDDLARKGLSSWLLRNRFTDWHSPAPRLGERDEPAPAADARSAVRAAREAHPGLPVVLLGHSMGGRAALRAADEDGVVGVVGLEPWLPAEESPDPLTGRYVALAASRHDTEVPWAEVEDFARRASAVTTSVHTEQAGWNLGPLNEHLGHGMTSDLGHWHRFAITHAAAAVDA